MEEDIKIAYKAHYFLSDSGDLYVDGTNTNFELGNGDTTMVIQNPTIIASNVKQYSEGFFHCAYITNDDKLYTIGNNKRFQCSGSTNLYESSKYIASNVNFVSCGPYSTTYFRRGKVLTMGGFYLSENNYQNSGTTLLVEPISKYITPYSTLKAYIYGPFAKGYIIHDNIENKDYMFFMGDNTYGKLPLLEKRVYSDLQRVEYTRTIQSIDNMIIGLKQSFILKDKKLYILGDGSSFHNIGNSSTPILIENNVDEIFISKDYSTVKISKNNMIYEKVL